MDVHTDTPLLYAGSHQMSEPTILLSTILPSRAPVSAYREASKLYD